VQTHGGREVSPPPRLQGTEGARSWSLQHFLLFQIYWLVGATVITDLKGIRTRLEKIELEYAPVIHSLDILKAQNRPEDQTDIAKQNAKLEEIGNRLWVERISAHTNFDVLKNWNVAKFLLLWRTRSQTPTTQQTPSAQSAEEDLGVKPNDRFLWAFTAENVVEMQTAQIILTALIKYILPILYGALGASAYIVRALANEIGDLTYSSESDVRYLLRFYLGAVAGFSIAWFTSEASSPENVGILQSLSPLALAFLAGYSVDLLFSLLDRLVVAFSGDRSVSATRPIPSSR
jgi:hypothetical protein